ncbi:hypothetical protein FRB99_000644 [Tulasnella sp. 403]|nr:hypothetical protein FRB99_000644 [Tulasnella sp. 403]
MSHRGSKFPSRFPGSERRRGEMGPIQLTANEIERLKSLTTQERQELIDWLVDQEEDLPSSTSFTSTFSKRGETPSPSALRKLGSSTIAKLQEFVSSVFRVEVPAEQKIVQQVVRETGDTLAGGTAAAGAAGEAAGQEELPSILQWAADTLGGDVAEGLWKGVQRRAQVPVPTEQADLFQYGKKLMGSAGRATMSGAPATANAVSSDQRTSVDNKKSPAMAGALGSQSSREFLSAEDFEGIGIQGKKLSDTISDISRSPLDEADIEDLRSNLFQKPPQQRDSSQSAEKEPLPPATTSDAPSQPAEGQGSKDIESLFRNLVPTTAAQPSPPNAPLPVSPEPPVAPSTANSERQAALLSLLGTVGVNKPTPPSEPSNLPPASTSQSANQSPSQLQQGKLLLEQLVAGNILSPPPPSTNQAQVLVTNPSTNQQQSSAPPVEMPASHSQPPPSTHGQSAASANSAHLSDLEAAAEAQRKNIFDYVSPYDALPFNAPAFQGQAANPGQTNGPNPAKKKPVPAYNPSPAPVSNHASPQVSPRQAQLQRRHTPSPELSQYGPYQPSTVDRELYPEPYPPPPVPQAAVPGDVPEGTVPPPVTQQQLPAIPHGPLPPIPTQPRQQSPISNQRGPPQVQQPLPSPPMRPAYPASHPPPHPSPPPQAQRPQEIVQQQTQGQRGRGSPASIRQGGQPGQGGLREGAGSPAGSGSGSASGGSNKRSNKQAAPPPVTLPQQIPQQQRSGRQSSTPSGHSLITIDTSLPLTSTLAAPDIVQITPIALLKLEPTYTRGTTIGVANFIAYSMSRGRIRLIGRQTGERALLKLPATFPTNAQVQDMVISGTKLACVSTDGGLVVWDIPEDIEDDAATMSRIILHVPPQPDVAGFKVVKWHPKQPGTLAVASEREIYLLNIDEAYQAFGSDGVTQEELGRVSTVFSVPSPLVSFTFDVPQIALASISIDSTITLWSIKDKLPFWSGRVHGDGYPSSIDFLEGGLVVGRNQGNIIQLLPVMSTTVLSTIKFTLGPGSAVGPGKSSMENPELMFGHLCYDPTSKILWVANSARNSLFAVKIGLDATPIPSIPPSGVAGGPAMATAEPTTPTMRPTFEQIVEFPCSMPTINLTVVPAEAAEENSHWTRDISLVVSAFCVHAGGVDQINISQEGYDDAIRRTAAKLPNIAYGVPASDRAERRTSAQGMASNTVAPPPPQPSQQSQAQQYLPNRPEMIQLPPGTYPPQQSQQIGAGYVNQRSRSPPSDPDRNGNPSGFDSSASTAVASVVQQPQNSGKGKNKDTNVPGGKQWKASPNTANIDAVNSKSDTEALTAGLTKEIRKVEESLHTRIGRLIVKELDKQHARLDEVRRADQSADFERQEKILKLISTELTKNTTRVVESAVKNVIQSSVLPALETVTRAEIKTALNGQIAKGMADSMKQTLPVEIEKLLLRPDVSNNVARTFSAAITPAVERHVKDTINKTLIPAYTQATDAMHQEMSREMRAEILNLKKEVVTWQSEALKTTESLVREMEQSIRSLSEQVRTLSAQVARNTANTPRTAMSESGNVSQEYSHHRSTNAPPPPSNNGFMPYGQQPGGWINAPATQPIQQPLGPPPILAAPPQAAIQPRTEEWDDTFLTTLGYHDQKKLRELLARCPPEVVMPSGQPSPLSQTVILALIHRRDASAVVQEQAGEHNPADPRLDESCVELAEAVRGIVEVDQQDLPTDVQRSCQNGDVEVFGGLDGLSDDYEEADEASS